MAYPDLCTRAQVRAFLQKPNGDTKQDAIIDSLIRRASTAIQRYTEREFVSKTPGTPPSPVTRKFEIELLRDGWLDLAPFDAQTDTITSVVIDSELAQQRTLGTDEWRPWPIPSADGVISALRIVPTTLGGYHRFRHRQVAITAVWGWPDIPADIEHAAIVTTTTWLRREVSSFSSTYKLDEDRIERPEALPSAVRAMVNPYRRQHQG